MKRIKTQDSQSRDYGKLLKEYFGKYLYGLEVKNEGGRTQVQLIYFDFKHIDTVRRELAQTMPEVEFTKLKREFTNTALCWVLGKMVMEEYRNGNKNAPVFYAQHGDTLVKSTLLDIALTELNQLELEEDDNLPYDDDSDLRCCCPEDNETLIEHALD